VLTVAAWDERRSENSQARRGGCGLGCSWRGIYQVGDVNPWGKEDGCAQGPRSDQCAGADGTPFYCDCSSKRTPQWGQYLAEGTVSRSPWHSLHE
jgi:hypothetical protein